MANKINMNSMDYNSADKPDVPETYAPVPGYLSGKHQEEPRYYLPVQWWILMGLLLMGIIATFFFVLYNWLTEWAAAHAQIIDILGYVFIFAGCLIACGLTCTVISTGYQWVRGMQARNAQRRIGRSRMNNPFDVVWFNGLSAEKKMQMLLLFEQEANKTEIKIAPYRKLFNARVVAEGDSNMTDAHTELRETEQTEQAIPAAQKTDGGLSKLEQLKREGLISRSDNSWNLGYDKRLGTASASTAQWLDVGTTAQHSVFAVTGSAGSGKTTYVRWLLAQAAIKGSALVLCDPQGNMGGEAGKQTLLQSIGNAISKNFLIPPAVTDDEIYSAVEQVDRIGKARAENSADSDQHIVLVIDEFNHVARNHPRIRDITRCLKNIANSYRKVNITVLLIIHNWRVSEWKDATARDAVQGYIILRMNKSEANIALQSLEDRATYASRAGSLKNGEAFFWAEGKEAPVLMYQIPAISRDDMEEAEALYVPIVRATVRHNDGARDDDVSAGAPVVVSDNVSVLRELLGVSDREDITKQTEDTDRQTDAAFIAKYDTLEGKVEMLREWRAAGITREEARARLQHFGLKLNNNDWAEAGKGRLTI